MLGDQHRPLVAGQRHGASDHPSCRVDAFLGPVASEHERTRIAGVGQEVVHGRIGRGRPPDPTGPGRTSRQQQSVLAQRQQHLARRAELGEPPEHGRDRLHHSLVGAEYDLVVMVVVKPDRETLAQLTTFGFVAQTGGQPGPDQMQLGLAHRALQPEDEPVVEVTGVIDTVGVGDQRVRQRAQVQQLVPVGVVAGQPAHLDPEDDPDLTQADIGDQLLEPFPGGGL